jgi:hypothetical protein
MTTTSEKILQSIKEENIQPQPRWKFLAKNSALWIMFAIALFVGALSFSVIVNLLMDHDWDIYLRLHKTFGQYMLLSLPYLWIMCLLIFSSLAYYDFVHIKGWYRHRVYAVVSISIIGSLFLGILLFCSGVGKKIDQVLDARVPFYEMMNINKKKIWCHPDEGLLGGEIMKMPMETPDRFTIVDCNGHIWEIDKSELRSFGIKVGEKIKIIGKEINGRQFEAEEFRHW